MCPILNRRGCSSILGVQDRKLTFLTIKPSLKITCEELSV